jgi:hypothetical protein
VLYSQALESLGVPSYREKKLSSGPKPLLYFDTSSDSIHLYTTRILLTDCGRCAAGPQVMRAFMNMTRYGLPCAKMRIGLAHMGIRNSVPLCPLPGNTLVADDADPRKSPKQIPPNHIQSPHLRQSALSADSKLPSVNFVRDARSKWTKVADFCHTHVQKFTAFIASILKPRGQFPPLLSKKIDFRTSGQNSARR